MTQEITGEPSAMGGTGIIGFGSSELRRL